MVEYRITEGFVREWNRVRAKVDGLRGDGVTNSPGAISISNPRPLQLPAVDDGEQLWVYKINGQCTEPGTYTANGYLDDLADAVSCPAAALDMLSQLTGPTGILVVNTEENGLTPAHWLENNSVGYGLRRGTDSALKPIIVTQGGRYRSSGGAVIGESGMKDSHVTTPDGEPDNANWNRDTSDAPLEIWLPTGFRNDPGSPGDCQHFPPKMWMYKRLFTEDAGGRLHSFTSEVASIFAVGCCPPQTTISSPTFASAEEAMAASIIHNTIAISGLL